jgi:glycosyltransferase involved in cell wall biosynthesis
MISICITIHNRSKLRHGSEFLYLFPRCIDSLIEAVRPLNDVEIVIADWSSADWRLDEWLHDRLRGLKYTLLVENGQFNRGVGRNLAADHAKGDILFFLDADMLLDKDVILQGLSKVNEGAAYFPQCFYFIDKDHSQGFWCTGKGNCMVKKEWYLQAGKWPCPPSYTRETDEDWAFHRKITALGVPVHSECQPGLYHQFHPGRSVDIIFKRQQHLIVRTKDLRAA